VEQFLAERIWRGAVDKIGKDSPDVFYLYGTTSGLLLQACTAFDNQSSLAAVILARSVIEGAAYTYLNKKRKADGTWGIDTKARSPMLAALLLALRTDAKADPTLLDECDRVKTRGNDVAHNLVRIRETTKEEQLKLSGQSGKQAPPQFVIEPDISREDARADFQTAADILLELANLTAEVPKTP
jgi:hypothetical protein